MIIIFLFFSLIFVTLRGELWKEDLSSAMKIGLSTTGYKSVDLKCDAEHFLVNVTLDNDFEGVVYSRGSFHNKKVPCFKHHNQNIYKGNDKLVIGMKIPFNKCQTVMDVAESCYINTIVIQHDPELIMPGDSAFNLQCAFVPEFKVSSNVSMQSPFKSKITLVNADPAENELKTTNTNFTSISETDNVSFVSNSIETHITKDEF